ncbi:unnamed protein product [Clonostachys chloroleuca]|uniref:SHSP domain-containing protein n=1 Tax=Clonostachys chloroleuca TaxID=1926264 RepID=A0AA35VAX1_9HYPO|nr:unnamed protein product [Clonostachys chloroleuca]
MAFFYPRTVYHSQPSFTPVFHLFNSRGSQCEPRRARNTRYIYRQPVRPWLPRFEAKETSDAYVIVGDLPGLSKEQVSVEFPESHKLVIRGTTERRAPQTSNAVQATPEPASEPAREAITEPTSAPATASIEDRDDDVSSVTTEASQEAKSVSSYQATVEDADDDDDDFEMVDASPEKPKEQEKKPQPKREEAPRTPERESSPSPQPQEQSQAPVPAVPEFQPAHTEQSRVRRFARTLNFPDGVELDHDAVTADLKDGLLRIVVPKVRRSEPRRVAIL